MPAVNDISLGGFAAPSALLLGVSIGETHAVQAEEDFADPIFTGRQDGGGSAKLGKSHIKQENIADPIFTGRNDN
jgi:hypothetical protein